MLVYILDDDVPVLPLLEELLRRHLSQAKQEAVILPFSRADAFLEQMRALPPDLCFLDLDLGKDQITGLIVAKKLREEVPSCQIVFLSNYLHYVTDAFEVEPTYYVLKDELQERLPAVLSKVLQHYAPDTSGSLSVTIQRRHLILPNSSILYLERVDRETKIVCTDQTLFTRESLPTLEKKLSRAFYRCHASFIVHFTAVEQLQSQGFLLRNHTVIPISRSNQKQARLLFSQFLAASIGL